jgi:hypothetical protein
MWPFAADIESVWLALYLLTFALHAVFVSYVAAGTAYALVAALRRRADPIAARTRDWLPFMLGAGITAGVGPLLFIQLLYQRRFYTANLLLGPRWGAVVPALIVGFYALYLAKASERHRRLALAVGALCFGFVAWSWTEVHQVMLADPAWAAMYGRGERLYLDPAIVPRLAMWLGAMPALYAAVAAWSAAPAERRTLARIAVLGLVISTAAGATQGFAPAHGWTYVLLAGLAATFAGWLIGRLPLATAGTAVALLAGAVVREAPRLALIERDRATAVGSGGILLFAATLGLGVVAITWVVRTVRAA